MEFHGIFTEVHYFQIKCHLSQLSSFPHFSPGRTSMIRISAWAQPTPSEASSTTLPLPYKYKVLAEMFRCTDTILNLLGQRKEKCTFTKLRDAVQQMSRK